MAVTHAVPTFADLLRTELDEREMGIRTLARLMAERAGQPERIESIRRQLRKYLSDENPVMPSAPSRNDVELALGLPMDALRPREPHADRVRAAAESLVEALIAEVRAAASTDTRIGAAA